MTIVEQLLTKWPLRSMGKRLGIELPERDGVKFCHPLRPDKNPSCTIKKDRLYDWSQGNGRSLDAIALFAMAKGVTNVEAIKVLAGEDTPARPGVRPGRLEATRPARPPFQKLETPTSGDLIKLGKLRNIFDSALNKAAKAGHLFVAETKEGRAYVVTDSCRRVCQSRRLDGQLWRGITAKAWTSIKDHGFAGWPLGSCDIGARQGVILCEGGPDWLVSHEAEPEIAVCAMLGAKQAIHHDALPLFAGKAVRILEHGDEAGRDASLRWATQLTAAGATVTAVRVNFGNTKDLNDCTHLSFEHWEKFKISRLLT